MPRFNALYLAAFAALVTFSILWYDMMGQPLGGVV